MVTPLCWKARPYRHLIRVTGPNGEFIATMHGRYGDESATADAAFIVKAVNNHAALFETLKFLLEVMEISCVQHGTDITNPTPESALGRARLTLERAA
jgi:hypothetical protein